MPATATHADDFAALAQLADDGGPHHEGRRRFHRRPPAARFWSYFPGRGYVRLTLRPGESVTVTAGGPTDEGANYSAETYTHDGDGILLEWASWGSDCDGRHEAGGESFARLDDLTARDPYAETGGDFAEARGLRVPFWTAGPDRWQRDHTAEAAGY
jgi:hypothetical protein